MENIDEGISYCNTDPVDKEEFQQEDLESLDQMEKEIMEQSQQNEDSTYMQKKTAKISN